LTAEHPAPPAGLGVDEERRRGCGREGKWGGERGKTENVEKVEGD